MNLLSALWWWRRERSARTWTPDLPDRRADERYDVLQRVTVGPIGAPPLAGTVTNLSLGGAAIRIDGWQTSRRGAWLSRLNQSQEMLLVGLLDTPIYCRVVVVDDGILRVHFQPDDTSRRGIRELIDRLTPPRADRAMPPPAPREN